MSADTSRRATSTRRSSSLSGTGPTDSRSPSRLSTASGQGQQGQHGQGEAPRRPDRRQELRLRERYRRAPPPRLALGRRQEQSAKESKGNTVLDSVQKSLGIKEGDKTGGQVVEGA